ncbi:hypothetical protein [Cellulomonas soli]|nr:hypothetical protein [Cellulomonas soli]NYI58616.1 hypothetical protein [Cellulomonas soli]
MAEYESYPLWRERRNGVTNVSPESLGLPVELAAQLDAWASQFDSTLDVGDPANSGFTDPSQERTFYAEGLVLAKGVAEALGEEAEVVFYDGSDSTLKSRVARRRARRSSRADGSTGDANGP